MKKVVVVYWLNRPKQYHYKKIAITNTNVLHSIILLGTLEIQQGLMDTSEVALSVSLYNKAWIGDIYTLKMEVSNRILQGLVEIGFPGDKIPLPLLFTSFLPPFISSYIPPCWIHFLPPFFLSYFLHSTHPPIFPPIPLSIHPSFPPSAHPIIHSYFVPLESWYPPHVLGDYNHGVYKRQVVHGGGLHATWLLHLSAAWSNPGF